MNEEKHWNNQASRYEDEIFDVFASDKNKKLPAYFRKHGNPDHDAIDFGCGVGKAFPYLSPLFKTLLGTDISSECLTIARKKPFTNITFKKADLTRRGLKFPAADFAFCCNVVMLPEIEKNESMLRNIRKSLKPGGVALLVLPSLDSILYSTNRLIEWNRREGVKPGEIPTSDLNYYKSKTDLLQGIIYINGVPTKHYSTPELEVLMRSAKLTVTAIDKVEYDWDTEFSEPPPWMKEPYPWDWLVECRNDS